MATKKKMLQAAAGSAGGAGLDITEVFSTYVYAGTSAEHTITNGIDLAGEGGMIWGKVRSRADQHWIVDSERGTGSNSNYKYVMPNLTTSELDFASRSVSSFNSNGFTLQNGTDSQFNESGQDYASWTFRKAPKFFDVVTWTGNGVSGRSIPHNLDGEPGFIAVKITSNADNWECYHRGVTFNSGNVLWLNSANAVTTGASRFPTAPDSNNFYLGSDSGVNGSGNTYIAYLFAHNNNDGEFGPDSDQDIIKCGSYTGNGSSSGNFVDLGFEPQFVIIKNASSAADWVMFDSMRGVVTSSSAADDKYLFPNGNNSEGGGIPIDFNATGFTVFDTSTRTNANTNTFIYMAIRRGPLAPPESGTDVFEVFETTNTGTASTIGSMGPSDFILNKRTDAAATWRALDRLRGGSMLRTDSTDTETSSGFLEWDKMGGVFVTTAGAPFITNDAQAHWSWKRAPGYFDVVAYSGDGVAGRTVSHNLGVAPEMMWVKKRSGAESWAVYHKLYGGTHFARLNQTGAFESNSNVWDNTNPTASVFTVDQDTEVNQSGQTYIAYLFATVPGVSKVGSYTGNDTGQNIDCGFTSGARFVLIKCSSHGDRSWMLFDSVRGIVAGADPFLTLNSSSAEYYAYNGAGSELNYTSSNLDLIDPYSSGFAVVGGTGMVNENGKSYIFYAIA